MKIRPGARPSKRRTTLSRVGFRSGRDLRVFVPAAPAGPGAARPERTAAASARRARRLGRNKAGSSGRVARQREHDARPEVASRLRWSGRRAYGPSAAFGRDLWAPAVLWTP